MLSLICRSEITRESAATTLESLKCNGDIWISGGRGCLMAHLLAKGQVVVVSTMDSRIKAVVMSLTPKDLWHFHGVLRGEIDGQSTKFTLDLYE